MLYRHWFIKRPSPGHIFLNNDTEVVLDLKMRNNAIDKRRTLKKASHGGRMRGDF